MKFSKYYGGVFWTNHALKRLNEREISQSDAWYTWKKPENSRYAASKKAWVYYRTYKHQRIEVVATKNDNGKWVILSVWSRPVRTKKHTIPKAGIVKRVIKMLRLIFTKKNSHSGRSRGIE